MHLWKVRNGFAVKWFQSEADARFWANIAFKKDEDGIPFIEKVELQEALSEVNAKYLQLEMTRLESTRIRREWENNG